jgi:hypothetical protein
MATTFLQAAKELCLRLRTSGAGPSSVLAQPGEYKNAISALAKAHKEIVTSHLDWSFLWREGTCIVSTGGANPSPPVQADVQTYDVDTFYYDGALLSVVCWDDYKSKKLTASEIAQTGSPESVVVLPNNSILALPYPDAPKTISFNYWAKASTLAADSDVLQIPDDSIEAVYDRAKMIWLGEEEGINYGLAEADFMVSYDALEDRYWPGKGKGSMAANQHIVIETL